MRRHPFIYEINTWVWLDELSSRLGRAVDRQSDELVDHVVRDARSRVPLADPDQRFSQMSLGAALENLLVAARAWGQDQYAVSVWELGETGLDAAVLKQRYDGVVDGRLDAARRLRPGAASALEPAVVVRPEASDQATVLEVRTADRPGVVYLVCAALAALDIAVRSAHVDTLGPQAVDVFYLQESGAGALADTRAAEAAPAVRAALSGPSSLPG